MAVFRLVEEDRLEDRDELRQPRCVGRRGDARLRRGRLGRELFGRGTAADDGCGVCRARTVRGVRPAARKRVVRGALRRPGTRRGMPPKRIPGLAGVPRPRYADDSADRRSGRGLPLSPDRQFKSRLEIPRDDRLLRTGPHRPQADVHSAARAGVVLPETASGLPPAAAAAPRPVGPRGRGTTPSRSSIRSRGACWWSRSRSKESSRASSSRPCTATAPPCCSGISTTGISVRPRWSTNCRSGPLPGVTV